MIDWLLDKGVDFPPNALKKDLYEIIKKQLLLEPNYDIDKLVQRVRPDITIERLPPYHCELNAIGKSISIFSKFLFLYNS